MKNIIVLLLLVLMPLIHGCLPLLVAGTGVAIGQGRRGEAKKIEARGEAYKQYQEVRLQYIRENAERAKLGLEPIVIPEYEEWLNIVSDKKLRKVADIETKKDQMTGKKEIEELKQQLNNNTTQTQSPEEKKEPKKNFGP